MSSATTSQQPFRFLDLPVELRCCVYDHIQITTTWYSLDRIVTLMGPREWPVPPVKQVHDSRITFIKPYTQPALNLLLTCRSINHEAHSILKRKVQHHKSQPLRYLVDYSAGHALIHPTSPLRRCLGVHAMTRPNERPNRDVRVFVDLCAIALSQVRRTQNAMLGPNPDYHARGVCAIELTITHKQGVVYGKEVLRTLLMFSTFRYIGPARCVIIYKSPLPDIDAETLRSTPFRNAADLEIMLQQLLPREPVNNGTRSVKGTYIRPLREDAFTKHLSGLDEY